MMQLQRISLGLCLVLTLVAAGCRGPADNGGAATTAPLKVTDVALGRAIGGDKAISDATDKFNPNDTVYASVTTEGSSPSATLKAKWTFQDGQTVTESSRTIAPTARERTEFHIAKADGWPVGKYKVEVFLNDQPAGTKTFDVAR